MGEFLVSVYFATYNQQDFVAETIESILKQKTDFKFNIVIYDDCSTDGTPGILRHYEQMYPGVIVVAYSAKNNYGKPQWLEEIRKIQREKAVGKYIAIAQGDDYWTDDNKLQIQIDLMEKNPECMLSSHAAMWIDELTGQITEFHPHKGDGYISPEELILKPFGNIPSASMVFRREAFFWDEAYKGTDVMDFPMQLYALSKGTVFYFDRVMSAYRSMRKGSWSETYNNDAYFQIMHSINMIEFLNNYDAYTSMRFHEIINECICKYIYVPILNCKIQDNKVFPSDEIFTEACERVNRDTRGTYAERKNAFINAYRHWTMQYIYKDTEKEEINSRKIYIYGAGDFANRELQILQKNNLNVAGIVVSDDADTNGEFEKIRVFHLCEVDNLCDANIIISLSQKWKKDVISMLKKYNCSNYYTPFWV